MQVAHSDTAGAALETKGDTAWFGAVTELGKGNPIEPASARTISTRRALTARTRLEVSGTDGLNAGDGDFTMTARIKTNKDGTIVAQTADRDRVGPPTG